MGVQAGEGCLEVPIRKAMTQRYPNILLFPGTIAWKKPMKETRRFFDKDRSKRAHRRLDFMTNKYNSGKGNYDQHKSRLTEALADDREVYYAQNTAYVMKKGKVVLKYHKMADGGEVFREDRQDAMVVWVPGNRKGTFSLDGLKFGLEICAERSARMLEQWNAGDVDVHVMIAASNNASPNTANITQGGYLLHADANHPPAAYQRAGGNSVPVAAARSFPSLGGTVSCYGLDFSK
jgi:predicted amidohydrolase